MSPRSTDLPTSDGLAQKRERLELLKGLLVGMVVVTMLLLLGLGVVLLQEIRQAQDGVAALTVADREWTEAQRKADADRIQADLDRNERLIRHQQAQLDDLDARTLDRLRVILRAIRAHQGGPRYTLTPTPTRTTRAGTLQAPAPRPGPAPCPKRNGKCK